MVLQRKVGIEIKGRKITVVGLGRSGVGAANVLSELGAVVTVTDKKKEEELKDFIERLRPSVRLILGNHPENLFISADMVVVSPGVPLNILPLSKTETKGVPIIGELELAYQVITEHRSVIGNQNKFLAITGTNGKSTTTALLNFMLKAGGFKTILGGNIGVALTDEIFKRIGESVNRRNGEGTVDYIVTEVSSFQLESIKDFRPKEAVILNITPDHLDRYHSLSEYSDAKARILANQKEGDFLLLNADDPEVIKVAHGKLKDKSVKPNVLYFSRKKEVMGVYFKGGKIHCNMPQFSVLSSPFLLIDAHEIKIKGVHNLENAMAASAMAFLAGCSPEAVRDSLREFPGLEHRLEFVREIDGVKFFNDSKGTNIGAVVKSLESFQEPIILIAGGRDKAGDFLYLRNLVREKVKALVLIGEASEKIKKALGDISETIMAKNLQDAVYRSRDIAVKGDVILLSPACTSFDMFRDFEDRGGQFKEIVMELA